MENSGFAMEMSLATKNWWGDDYLQEINGFWMLPQFVPSINRVINQFKPLPSDVILASFPKTGTTWLKSLLYSIINRSSKDNLATKNPHDLVSILEVQVYTTFKESSMLPACDIHSSRIFSTHIPYQLLAKTLESSPCRVVYVTRNPKDTLISTWHFMNKWKKAEKEPWHLEVAVDKFCDGIVPCGPYYDHVMGYKKESLEKLNKVLFLTYEELMEDPKAHVKKLAEFLGCPFEGEDEEKRVEDIVHVCSFVVLSNHEVNKSTNFPSWFQVPYNSFFRKGVVGDHKNYLNTETIDRIDALTREKFYTSGFNYGI